MVAFAKLHRCNFAGKVAPLSIVSNAVIHEAQLTQGQFQTKQFYIRKCSEKLKKPESNLNIFTSCVPHSKFHIVRIPVETIVFCLQNVTALLLTSNSQPNINSSMCIPIQCHSFLADPFSANEAHKHWLKQLTLCF